jgi:diguanylate cyclase (GGDEF)-like protein
MEMLTSHSAIKSAMHGCEIREDAVIDKMMRAYLTYASQGRVTSYVPLLLLISCANELAAGSYLFFVIIAQIIVLTVQTSFAVRAVANFDDKQLVPPMRGFTVMAFLSGALWGLAMTPVLKLLGDNVTAAIMCVTIFISITLTASLQAGQRQFIRAYLSGFGLLLVPQLIYRIDSLGLIPLVATIILLGMLIWIGEIIRRQSRASVRAQMENSVLADQLADALRRARYFSQRDSLTGLLNRRAFEEAAVALKANSATDAGHAVILIDLDHFKAINDSYGHAIGDVVLKSVAGLIVQSLRPSDIAGRGDGTAARWGGEEFVILLNNCSPEQAQCVAEAIRMRIAAHRDSHWPDALVVTGSLGVAPWQGPISLQSVISHADQAMYGAKRAGRNQTRVHAPQ